MFVIPAQAGIQQESKSMKRKKGSVGISTHIPSLTRKQKGQVFSEIEERQEKINDIHYWKLDSFGRPYHTEYS